MLGLTQNFSPRFLRRYAQMGEIMDGAVKQYIADVKAKDFPNAKEQY
jgi:3-methyl-2-oxobutanoate hydroxymethyltransferase